MLHNFGCYLHDFGISKGKIELKIRPDKQMILAQKLIKHIIENPYLTLECLKF